MLRAVTAGMANAVLIQAGPIAVSVVVLPAELADRVWRGEIAGVPTVVVADIRTELVLFDSNTVHTRGTNASTSLWMIPAPVGGLRPTAPTTSATVTGPAKDGVFAKFVITTGASSIPTATYKLIAPAGPARTVEKQKGGKAREPTGAEWSAAAVYSINLSGANRGPNPNVELRLRINYAGDAARVYLAERCLTDNFFSGYKSDGGLEVRAQSKFHRPPVLL